MASANFYNNSALMRGMDLHHAQLIVSPTDAMTAKGTTQEDWPYLVIAYASSSSGDDGKRTPKLTGDGLKMIRDGFTVGNFAHVPAPGPYHPAQALEVISIIQASKTTPLLKVATVTSAGDPLSVCAIRSVGANLNCQDGGMKVTGIVVCVCSVQTSPQAKDLLFRIFDDFFKQMLNKWLTNLFDTLLKLRKVPWPIRPVLVWVFKKFVAKAVDWLEERLKDLWDEVERRAKEPPQLQEPEDPPPPSNPDPPPSNPDPPPSDPDPPPPSNPDKDMDDKLRRKMEHQQHPFDPRYW